MNKIDFETYTENTIDNLCLIIKKLEDKWIDLSQIKEYIENKGFKNRVLLLWWNQIGWSYSPIIHTLSSLNSEEVKDFLYTLINLESEGDIFIKDMLKYLENSENILGSNITMPYKISVFNILEAENKLDESALLVGAVNTIWKEENKIKGYNTDIEWIVWPIKSKLSVEVLENIKKWYILWAWWAAMAGIAALLSIWITNITFFNRENIPDIISHFTSEKVKENLKNNYWVKSDIKISFVEYDVEKKDKISYFIDDRGILINTLPFWFKEKLPSKAILDSEFDKIKDKIELFFDVVYDMNHWDTPMLKDFKNNDILTCDWHDMLIWQALKWFELWTDWWKIDTDKINKLLR